MKKIIFLCFLLLISTNALASSNKNVLDFQVISSKTLGKDTIEIKVKITNLTNKHISDAHVTCILEDEKGKEITSQKHNVSKSSEGGLLPNKSTYFTYILFGDPSKAKSISFQYEVYVYEDGRVFKGKPFTYEGNRQGEGRP